MNKMICSLASFFLKFLIPVTPGLVGSSPTTAN